MNTSPIFKKSDRYKLASYRTFNKTADRYDSLFWLRYFKVAEWDSEIIAELKPGLASLRILDVGCATGRLLEQLAHAGAAQLAGVDLAPKMVALAQQKLANYQSTIALKTADAEDNLPWPNEFFDVVTLTGVLHHFYRPLEALAEIYRVLGATGRLIIIEPKFKKVIRRLLNLSLRFIPGTDDYRFYSVDQVFDLLGNFVFREMQSRKVGRASYMIVAQKNKL